MRLSERLDHMLREYNYKRKRGYTSNNRSGNDFNMEEFLAEVDTYIDEIAEGVNKILPKSKR